MARLYHPSGWYMDGHETERKCVGSKSTAFGGAVQPPALLPIGTEFDTVIESHGLQFDCDLDSYLRRSSAKNFNGVKSLRDSTFFGYL